MVSGGVTVPSVFAKEFGVSVTGTHTLAYATQFGAFVSTALGAESLAYSNLSDPGATIPGYVRNTSVPVSAVEQEISRSGHILLPDTVSGPVYTLVSAVGSTSIVGSGMGDTLLVSDPDAAVTYIDRGGNNLVTFVHGDNSFVGEQTSSDGTNTIVGGSGHDTITTGSGHAVVFAGSGSTEITLYDTVSAGATDNVRSTQAPDYSQFVYSDDGSAVIHADGTADVVVATAAGQQIFTGATGQTDLIALVPPTSGTAPANDLVNAGAAYVSVYDATDGNTIAGGTGHLVVLFADSVSATVQAGSGSNTLYGHDGDTIAYQSGTSGSGIFVLGSGAESVDASGSAGRLTMVLGTGQETLTGGALTNYNANFMAGDAGGSVTINDFGQSSLFNFVGYTADQYEAALATGTQTSAGYSITLSDHTTVTFVGLTDLAGHTERS